MWLFEASLACSRDGHGRFVSRERTAGSGSVCRQAMWAMAAR